VRRPHLLFLTLVALVAPRRPRAGPAQRLRGLDPAHDELVIAPPAPDLDALDYPGRYDVCVVADNCDALAQWRSHTSALESSAH
jgi:hypothetical protein